MQVIILDAMVPRQRLELRLGPPFIEIFSECRATGRPVCMLGIDPRSQTVLKTGVEARIESLTKVVTLFYPLPSFLPTHLPSSLVPSHPRIPYLTSPICLTLLAFHPTSLPLYDNSSCLRPS